MRFLSLFSGIEAASEAWAPLGWECVGFSEIEPFPCRVLAHHHPLVPNLGNVLEISEARVAELGRVDLVIFGSPCQDLSIAGKRQGLQDGTRSNLFFTAMLIAGWLRKHCGLRFALWENVPGAFTSNAGADFASVVAAMGDGHGAVEVPPKGWGTEGVYLGTQALVEWATLDAQWFGVAQRRRRLFALADFGDWSGRPPILLEPQGVRGDSAPSRGPQEDVAGTLTTGLGRRGAEDPERGLLIRDRPVQVSSTGEVAHCLNAGGMGRLDYETETMLSVLGFHAEAQPEEFRADPHTSASLTTSQHSAVCITGDITHALNTCNNGKGSSEDGTGRGTPTIVAEMQVRRLTPRECERLQGFEDDHTLLPGKAPDGPRYKALGNSMAVPVIRWIGRAIDGALLWQQQ